MKTNTILLFLSIFFLFGCKKEKIKTQEPMEDTILFVGKWQRTFEASPEKIHTASYFIYQDSIRYILAGPLGNANYLLQKDTFINGQNRFIGHNNHNQHFLLLAKNIDSFSLVIYKQRVTDISEGLNIEIPSDTTTKNYGWNIFKKQ